MRSRRWLIFALVKQKRAKRLFVMTESQILFFVITSIAIILVPGQDLVLVMSRGITQGAKAGITTAAGVSTGLLGHTLLTGLGLGAILLASDFMFTLLKYLGAAYLIYLGVRLLISRAENLAVENVQVQPLPKLFIQGALSNISNPKITIFYFAYLPQFIGAESSHATIYLLALGASFALLTFLIKAPIGYFAGLASQWIKTRPFVIQWINRVSGTVLLGLGGKLAFEER